MGFFMDKSDFIDRLLVYKNLSFIKLEGKKYTYVCNFCNKEFTATWDTHNFIQSLGKMGCVKCSKTYTGKYRAKLVQKEPVLTFKEIALKLNVQDSNVKGIVKSAGIKYFKIPECFYILEKDFDYLKQHYLLPTSEKVSATRKHIIELTTLENYLTYEEIAKKLHIKKERITEWVKRLNLKPVTKNLNNFLSLDDFYKIKSYFDYRQTPQFKKNVSKNLKIAASRRTPAQKAAISEKRSYSIKKSISKRTPDQWLQIAKQRGRKFHYKNEKFDSSWELAVWIYGKENGWDIEREPIYLEYKKGNKLCKYFPDFKINGQLVEIKGDQFFDEKGNLRNPFTKELLTEKMNCMKQNNVIIWKYKDIKPYIEYVNDTKGVNFLRKCKTC